ncbi:MAG: hypothetical protein Q8O52_13645 [Sulfuritalea sp.]|nr:hypothetical protein [Sulfuritalea sp.]
MSLGKLATIIVMISEVKAHEIEISVTDAQSWKHLIFLAPAPARWAPVKITTVPTAPTAPISAISAHQTPCRQRRLLSVRRMRRIYLPVGCSSVCGGKTASRWMEGWNQKVSFTRK